MRTARMITITLTIVGLFAATPLYANPATPSVAPETPCGGLVTADIVYKKHVSFSTDKNGTLYVRHSGNSISPKEYDTTVIPGAKILCIHPSHFNDGLHIYYTYTR